MGFFAKVREKYHSFRRYNQILRVFVRYGFEELVSYMIQTGRFSFLRRLIPSTTKKRAQKYTKYEKMRLVCEELGPTFIKFAQILSSRADILPNELIQEFEKLQDNVPPIPGEVAKLVVENELRNSVENLFAYFETEAFASASMAQVHRVTLKSGEKIVLKIQRPGIREIILEDIKVMYFLAEVFEKRIPTLAAFNPKMLVKNFEESIIKEMDFINESKNAQRFSNNINNDKADRSTYTLKVYREFSTTKVLALEYVRGIKISDISQLEAKGVSPKLIAHKLATSYIKQVFEYGFFHADPHPGNIMVVNGEVCFLDFGMMGSIMERDIEMFGKLFISVQNKNIKGVIRALQQMSQVTVIPDMRSLEFAVNEFVQNYQQGVHENEMSNVLMQLKDVIVDHGLNVPGHFFLLARSMVTVEGVIRRLDPELDVLDVAKPYLIRAITKRFNPFTLGKKVLTGLAEFSSYMEDFPLDLKNAIRKINNGKVSVDLTHKGIDPMIHTINRVTKQIIQSLLAAGFVIGSAMFIIDKVEPLYHGYSVFGIIGSGIAVVLAYGMWRDLRKGDHDDWKGWKD